MPRIRMRAAASIMSHSVLPSGLWPARLLIHGIPRQEHWSRLALSLFYLNQHNSLLGDGLCLLAAFSPASSLVSGAARL